MMKPWQLWPEWAIYSPILPLIFFKLIRNNVGVLSLLNANPALAYGGTALDGKFSRYQLFHDCEEFIRTILIPAQSHIDEKHLWQQLRKQSIDFPIIIKPNLGYLGHGVRRFGDIKSLLQFTNSAEVDVVLQPFIADPYEYSVFYYRFASEEAGHILDLTQRVLPNVTGDGNSSVEQLIDAKTAWKHSRSRVRQVSDIELSYVPKAGEQVSLSVAASGAQGAIFVDSRHLITPSLEERFNKLANIPGFNIGKFDFKIPNHDDLSHGVNLQIMEVNGVTSELNYIYDRKISYSEALRAIARQVSIIVEILVQNRQAPRISFKEIASQYKKFVAANKHPSSIGSHSLK